MKSWGNGLEKGSHEWTQGKRFDYKTKWEFDWGYAFIINFLQEMCIFFKISYMLCRVNHYEMYEVRVNLIKSGQIRFFKFCCITSGYCGEENAERLFFTSLIKHTPDIPSQGLNIDKVSAFKLPDMICLYSNKSNTYTYNRTRRLRWCALALALCAQNVLIMIRIRIVFITL